MRHQDNRHTAGALAAATRFGLKSFEAKKILRELFTVVSGWRATGKRLRLKAPTLVAYSSACQYPPDKSLAGNTVRGSPAAQADWFRARS